ncbi:MAG: VCBS repeat-containing protein [Planctomycetota bacterium]|nr:VCBS repeat-containing protein [Planctomycetota bacterium]
MVPRTDPREGTAVPGGRHRAPLVARPTWQLQPGGVPRALALGASELFWLDRDGLLVSLTWPTELSLLDAAPTKGAAIDLGRDARPVEVLPLAAGGVVVLCQGDRSLRFLGEQAGALVEQGRHAFDGVPRSGTEADLDGDGDLEQAFFGGDRRVLIFGLGDEPVALEQPNLVPMAAHGRDLDGDGRDELVALGHLDQGYSVLGGFVQHEGTWRASVAVSEYAGQDPWDLALGDFDGDGHPDLASACRGAGAISILAGSGIVREGKPAFHQAGRIGVGSNPLSIAAFDANGDGRPEVATLDAADGRLSLLANDGFGTLSLATRVAVGPSPRGLARLATGGHGVLVAVSVPPGARGRLVAFGPRGAAEPGGDERGFGQLEVLGAGDVPPSEEAGIAVGDLDGDGRDDLALLDVQAARVVVLHGRGLENGRLGFERGADLELAGLPGTEALGSPRALAILRRPEGGRIAVAGGVGPGGLARVLLLDPETGQLAGDVSLLPQPSGQPIGRGCGRLAAGDLDGDGFDDLVALWLGPQGTSPGRLSTHRLTPGLLLEFQMTTGLAPADLVVGDLNGDGLDDLVLAAQNSHLVQLWTNAGGAGFHAAPAIGVGLGPIDLCLVDLVGKGLVDLVVANAFSADVSRVLNRPRSPR